MEKPAAPISPERQSDEVTMVVTQEVHQIKPQNTFCPCPLHRYTEAFSDLMTWASFVSASRRRHESIPFSGTAYPLKGREGGGWSPADIGQDLGYILDRVPDYHRADI